MWQKHKTHLANFDKSSLRIIWFRWAPLLGCRHIEMSRAEMQQPADVVVRPAIKHVLSPARQLSAGTPWRAVDSTVVVFVPVTEKTMSHVENWAVVQFQSMSGTFLRYDAARYADRTWPFSFVMVFIDKRGGNVGTFCETTFSRRVAVVTTNEVIDTQAARRMGSPAGGSFHSNEPTLQVYLVTTACLALR